MPGPMTTELHSMSWAIPKRKSSLLSISDRAEKWERKAGIPEPKKRTNRKKKREKTVWICACAGRREREREKRELTELQALTGSSIGRRPNRNSLALEGDILHVRQPVDAAILPRVEGIAAIDLAGAVVGVDDILECAVGGHVRVVGDGDQSGRDRVGADGNSVPADELGGAVIVDGVVVDALRANTGHKELETSGEKKRKRNGRIR